MYSLILINQCLIYLNFNVMIRIYKITEIQYFNKGTRNYAKIVLFFASKVSNITDIIKGQRTYSIYLVFVSRYTDSFPLINVILREYSYFQRRKEFGMLTSSICFALLYKRCQVELIANLNFNLLLTVHFDFIDILRKLMIEKTFGLG